MAGPARAQSANSAGDGSSAPASERPSPPRAAVEHYEKGRALYLAGRYREAVTELEAALALDPDSPNLVYNLAHVYELLGDIDPAIRQYRRYRDLLPESERDEIARVEGTLQRLEGARDEVVDSAPAPAPAAPAPAPAPQHGVADAAFWTLTTFALGGFVTGGVLGKMALDADRSAKDFVIVRPEDIEQRQNKIDRTNQLALGADISLLAGAVLGTTAILLFALRKKPVSAAAASLGVDANAKGAFLTFRGRL